jgi:hypothetical protein
MAEPLFFVVAGRKKARSAVFGMACVDETARTIGGM